MAKFSISREHNDAIGWHFAVYECGVGRVALYDAEADAREYINARLFSD